MTKIIHENHGTIDKYMGDAVMVFWGAPVSDEEHARHAPETGIAMLERLHAIQENFSAPRMASDQDWCRPEFR